MGKTFQAQLTHERFLTSDLKIFQIYLLIKIPLVIILIILATRSSYVGMSSGENTLNLNTCQYF